MKRARLKVDLILLAQLLCLPDGVTIERVITDPRIERHTLCELVLSGAELPVDDVQEGQVMPEVNALIPRRVDIFSDAVPITTQLYAIEG